MKSINTASDNSSENSSSNINNTQDLGKKSSNNSTKSEIELVDKKIIKCINEINSLKQKMQSKFCFLWPFFLGIAIFPF